MICFRWSNEAQTLSESLENVVGDVLIAAAFIAYLGPFTVEYRQVSGAYFTRICTSKS